jgi:hypothetical protein
VIAETSFEFDSSLPRFWPACRTEGREAAADCVARCACSFDPKTVEDAEAVLQINASGFHRQRNDRFLRDA